MHNNKQTQEERLAKQEDPLAYLFGLEQFGIKLGLHNIRILTAALESPESSFHSILVAGTNGKGSVAAMIECGLRKAGYHTGLYTSPHLSHLRERFVVNGQAIAQLTLLQEAEDIQNIIAKAVEKVIAILMMLVLASDMISSNCATSADSTDIRFPVCLVSK